MPGPTTAVLSADNCRELGAVLQALDDAVGPGGGTTFAGELVLVGAGDEGSGKGPRLPVFWDADAAQHYVGVMPGEGV
jgi:hypothetical protein